MHSDPHSPPPTGRGSGFFGAGGVGGTRMNFTQGHHHITTPGTGGFGGGGASSGANGLEGGGAAGRGVTAAFGGFQGGGGTGGSFPNTPHLWGLRTDQGSTGGSGCAVFRFYV